MNTQTESLPQPDRFTKIGADGKPLPPDATEWEAVADRKTGLMWTVETKKSTGKKAAATAEKMKAAGFDDWRLPTVDELFLLADRTRYSPAIDEEYFPDTPSDWFWSSTPYAPGSGCAWIVSFGHGGSSANHLDLRGFVRAVRGGQ